MPNGPADLPPQADEITRDEQDWIGNSLRTLRDIRPWIVEAKEGRRDYELYDQLQKGFWFQEDIGERYIKAAELWDEYEDYLKTTLDPAVPNISTIHCLSFIVNMKDRSASLTRKRDDLRRACDQASRVLTISIGILYTTARLTILVLLSTPSEQYPKESIQTHHGLDFYQISPNSLVTRYSYLVEPSTSIVSEQTTKVLGSTIALGPQAATNVVLGSITYALKLALAHCGNISLSYLISNNYQQRFVATRLWRPPNGVIVIDSSMKSSVHIK